MYIMEGMMKKEICVAKNGASAAASTLAIHRDSQIITKVKPKIRIIHIFAPEIIKTDVANFRELVQRLTGKPTEIIKKKKSSRTHKKSGLAQKKMDLRSGLIHHHNHRSGLMIGEKNKGEEEIWRGANSGGDLLGGFADELEGFMEQLNNDQFPLMIPMDASSHMDAYAAAQSQIA